MWQKSPDLATLSLPLCMYMHTQATICQMLRLFVFSHRRRRSHPPSSSSFSVTGVKTGKGGLFAHTPRQLTPFSPRPKAVLRAKRASLPPFLPPHNHRIFRPSADDHYGGRAARGLWRILCPDSNTYVRHVGGGGGGTILHGQADRPVPC